MSIDFKKIQKTLEKWFSDQTGLRQVVWDGDSRENLKTPYGELWIRSIIGLGVDENRSVLDESQDTGRELVYTTVGQRQLTVQCKITTRTNDPECKAHAYMEKLRTSLAFPSVKQLLADNQMSFARAGGMAVMSLSPVQKRDETVAVLEFIFNTTACVTESSEQTTVIEQYGVSSDVDGWPAGIEMDEEGMPPT